MAKKRSIESASVFERSGIRIYVYELWRVYCICVLKHAIIAESSCRSYQQYFVYHATAGKHLSKKTHGICFVGVWFLQVLCQTVFFLTFSIIKLLSKNPRYLFCRCLVSTSFMLDCVFSIKNFCPKNQRYVFCWCLVFTGIMYM